MCGNYGQTINELHKKFHLTNAESFNPCNCGTIILADDDTISNMTLKKMLEATNKYQIVSCYNGLEVCF
jgi:hypothetical protein